MSGHIGYDSNDEDKPSWDKHETLEDLIKERHTLTRRSMEYLQGMQGILQGELAKILKKYKISSFEVKGHKKEDEIKSDMQKIIEDTLSYKHELHPLREYVDSKNLDDDEFLQRLIDDIFTPHKKDILSAVGERDFMQQVQRYSTRQSQMLEQRASEYVMEGFEKEDKGHREAVAKYLSEHMGEEIKADDVGLRPDKHLNKMYQLIMTKYS